MHLEIRRLSLRDYVLGDWWAVHAYTSERNDLEGQALAR